MRKRIDFRPHHFLCALCFQGKGYSPAFVANYEKISAHLRDPATQINVVNHTDSICAPCPHKNLKLCATEEKVQELDANHAAILGIKAGDTLNWLQAKERIAENLTLEKFHKICATCSWKSLGICEQVITDFLENPTGTSRT